MVFKQHQSSTNEFVKKKRCLSLKLRDPFDKSIVHQPKCKQAALDKKNRKNRKDNDENKIRIKIKMNIKK